MTDLTDNSDFARLNWEGDFTRFWPPGAPIRHCFVVIRDAIYHEVYHGLR